MNDYQERLIQLLLEKNQALTAAQARTWIELLWDDFETSSAKAGATYMGSEMTERIVTQWVNRYGATLHEFVATNPKYAHLLNQDHGGKH
ncbi:YfhJ family protein [Bacillus pinisoli]|uniref:YfhJ family protein n=1 Tax=Bacillus pinisoli TaxID=2901866 RepID=UPI001FF1F4AB|nr:YfhJ family protein [Bacillus pinisoli]